MNTLYPIIRRTRRPLLPVEPEAAGVTSPAGATAESVRPDQAAADQSSPNERKQNADEEPASEES